MKKLSSLLLKNKKYTLAVIALLEAILILCSATFSWIEGSRDGKVNNAASSVSAGDGLYFTNTDGTMISSITLPDVTLQDCTSTDGRNFFFPTAESVKNSNTENIIYRAGTEADKNTKYISQEFNIVSYSQSKVYLEGSKVECANENILKALRISVNFNDGSDPVLLCPGTVTGYTQNTATPVKSINDDGSKKEVINNKEAYPLSQYNPSTDSCLAVLEGNQSKRVTINMWLEGTDTNCTTDKVSSAEINVQLVLTTASEYTKKITFVDYTPSNWVKNPSASGGVIKMFVIEKGTYSGTNYSEGTRYVMQQIDDRTYTAMVPENVTDVIFGRFDPDDPNTDFNYWATNQKMSDGDMDTYYAIGRGKDYDGGQNYGYWVKSSCTGVITIKYTDTNHTIASSASDYPHIYIWNSNLYGTGNDKIFFKTWCGFQMDKTEDRSNGHVYTFIIPAEYGIKFIINDKKGTDVSGYKRKEGSVSGKNQNENSTMQISY